MTTTTSSRVVERINVQAVGREAAPAVGPDLRPEGGRGLEPYGPDREDRSVVGDGTYGLVARQHAITAEPEVPQLQHQ
jgi:hypothetical protein